MSARRAQASRLPSWQEQAGRLLYVLRLPHTIPGNPSQCSPAHHYRPRRNHADHLAQVTPREANMNRCEDGWHPLISQRAIHSPQTVRFPKQHDRIKCHTSAQRPNHGQPHHTRDRSEKKPKQPNGWHETGGSNGRNVLVREPCSPPTVAGHLMQQPVQG